MQEIPTIEGKALDRFRGLKNVTGNTPLLALRFRYRGEPRVLYAKAENARLMLEDIRRTVPLAVAVAMLVAWLSFRSVRGVLIPAATTLISVAWTLGFIAAIGTPLNLLTVIIPTLLLVVGFAYAIHVVSEYYDVLMEREPGDESRREAASVATEGERQLESTRLIVSVWRRERGPPEPLTRP